MSDSPRARLLAAQRALAIEPGEWRHRLETVAALRLLGRDAEALQAIRDCARAHPGVGSVFTTLGHVEAARGASDLAARAFARAVELDPTDLDASLRLGTTRFRIGDVAGAEAPLRAAFALDPSDSRVRIALAGFCLRNRASAEARVLLEPLLDGEPTVEFASSWAQVCLAEGCPADALPTLHAARLASPGSALLAFAAGDVLDHLGEHAAAYASYDQGNRLMGRNWDPDAHARRVDALLDAYDSDVIAAAARSRERSEDVVLIVGMPRSGTSLLEQALACHPGIGGGGELDLLRRLSLRLSAALGHRGAWFMRPLDVHADVLDQLSGAYRAELVRRTGSSALRIDKTPDNVFHLGLAHLVLPGVRVLHVTRDPVDTGWSCFRQAFGDGLAWSRSLPHIAAYRASVDTAMTHWATVLPEAPFEVRYTDIVQRPEATLRQVLAFLGQPWDPAVLRPHESRRLVTTASHGEVQSPLHARSVGRAMPYQPWLGPLSG